MRRIIAVAGEMVKPGGPDKGGMVMNPTELCRLSIGQVEDLIRTEQLSPVDVTQAAVGRAADRREAIRGSHAPSCSVS